MERDEFRSAIKMEKLSVVREFGGADLEKGDYSVYAEVNLDFELFRTETNGTKKRSLYSDLRKKYPDLPAASGDDMDAQLRVWESNATEGLTFEKVRGFFGARNVANGKLKKKTALRLVPAVKETLEEATDAKRSPVIGLLSEIVRQTFENKAELRDFLSVTNTRLAELTDPSAIPQLAGISDRLTSTVRRYYSDTDLIADLNPAEEIAVTFPSPVISVLHRGLKVDVGSVGHGLQRAIFFSLVQFLAEEQADQLDEQTSDEFSEAQSDIILLIEEPEIYQHPLKQSLFYKAFQEIAAGFNKNSGIRIQIIFATHSEKFVAMQQIDKVRIISKRNSVDGFSTIVRSLSLGEFSSGIAQAIGAQTPLSDEAFAATLHIFSREISEGFFADKILLVEGVSDKAIFEGLYLRSGSSAQREGVSIIEVGGKTKIDKPLYAFKRLGIPVYAVFDNDKTAKSCKDNAASAKRNKLIQTICGQMELEEFPVGVFADFSCLDGNLEAYLKEEVREQYAGILDEVCTNFGIGARDAVKTPAAVSAFLALAYDRGHRFTVLEEVLERVRRL
jgi:hypothetical protein